MGFIRTLHIRKYDKDAKRFTSDTFKKHKNGGISVFDEECARQASRDSICGHIEQFYNTTVGNPICFCRIDEQLLQTEDFEGLKIEETQSASGDKCHRDLFNVSNRASKRFFDSHFKPPKIFICCNNEEVELTKEQYEDLLNNLC